MNTDEDGMAKKARDTFERSVRDLPVASANRLRLARRHALADDAGRAPGSRLARWRIPLAAAALLLVGIGIWRPAMTPPATPLAAPVASASVATPVPSLPLLANDDEADLYAWLAEAPVASDERSDGAL
jgi:hypothetical protein